MLQALRNAFTAKGSPLAIYDSVATPAMYKTDVKNVENDNHVQTLHEGDTVEVGRGYDPDLPSSEHGDLRQAGSVFVSVDTRFGPAFLAAGVTRGVSGALYLFLGPFW